MACNLTFENIAPASYVIDIRSSYEKRKWQIMQIYPDGRFNEFTYVIKDSVLYYKLCDILSKNSITYKSEISMFDTITYKSEISMFHMNGTIEHHVYTFQDIDNYLQAASDRDWETY